MSNLNMRKVMVDRYLPPSLSIRQIDLAARLARLKLPHGEFQPLSGRRRGK
jgi:hypothetical protein